MDRGAPPGYVESTEEALASAAAFDDYVRAKGSALLAAALTPRFVPTCTPELLGGLGALAGERGLRVQSHISESYDQVAAVEALHPGGGGDAALFDAAGLLCDKVCVEGRPMHHPPHTHPPTHPPPMHHPPPPTHHRPPTTAHPPTHPPTTHASPTTAHPPPPTHHRPPTHPPTHPPHPPAAAGTRL